MGEKGTNVKPVFQTKFTNPGGNCFQACVASILEVGLQEIPDFCNDAAFCDGKQIHYDRVTSWLHREFGMGLLCLKAEWFDGVLTEAYHEAFVIAGGRSPRSGRGHCVVWRKGRCVHDPYPEGGGLEGQPEDYCLFLCMDPGVRC